VRCYGENILKLVTLCLDAVNWTKNSEFRNSGPNSTVWSGKETRPGILIQFHAGRSRLFARRWTIRNPHPPNLWGIEYRFGKLLSSSPSCDSMRRRLRPRWALSPEYPPALILGRPRTAGGRWRGGGSYGAQAAEWLVDSLPCLLPLAIRSRVHGLMVLYCTNRDGPAVWQPAILFLLGLIWCDWNTNVDVYMVPVDTSRTRCDLVHSHDDAASFRSNGRTYAYTDICSVFLLFMGCMMMRS
jgi:hypothetical protein